jgi:hypothetical protein
MPITIPSGPINLVKVPCVLCSNILPAGDAGNLMVVVDQSVSALSVGSVPTPDSGSGTSPALFWDNGTEWHLLGI